jgi:hypothetical protein
VVLSKGAAKARALPATALRRRFEIESFSPRLRFRKNDPKGSSLVRGGDVSRTLPGWTSDQNRRERYGNPFVRHQFWNEDLGNAANISAYCVWDRREKLEVLR